MERVVFSSGRRFRLWRYEVGHKTALLRSPPTEGEASQVDVVLRGVERLEIPTTMEGLEITCADDGGVEDLSRPTRGMTPRVFRISGAVPSVIVAHTLQSCESRGADSDPSPLMLDRRRPHSPCLDVWTKPDADEVLFVTVAAAPVAHEGQTTSAAWRPATREVLALGPTPRLEAELQEQGFRFGYRVFADGQQVVWPGED